MQYNVSIFKLMETESILEQEIAELSKAIEDKRSALAAERGVVAEREVVHQVVSNYVAPSAGAAPAPTAPAPTAGNSYLDTLDPASVGKVNDLVASIGDKGFKQAISRAKEEIPYVLDAFHDALVTYLYDDLKKRGIVK
jgi:hypothetical protein